MPREGSTNSKSSSKNSSGKTSSSSVTTNRDGSQHVTTSVNIPGVGSVRSSYDRGSDGKISNGHFHDNSKK